MSGRQSLEGLATVGARVPAMGGDARTRGWDASFGSPMTARPGTPRAFGLRGLALALLCALGALLFGSAEAHAATCPTIQDKPQAIPHVNYQGVQHLTYCYGPVTINPGQNVIRLNATNLFPTQPGYITRFDPELVYPNGTVPRVDVLHLHHAVWVVNGNPQFAEGEEKTIVQLPRGFGYQTQAHRLLAAQRHAPRPGRQAGQRLHRLEGGLRSRHLSRRRQHQAGAHQVDERRRADAADRDLEPDLPRLRLPEGDGGKRRPLHLPRRGHRAARDAIDTRQQAWTPNQPVTLIGTAGHLHPGGLETSLRVQRGTQRRTLFHSKAHYYEPAGAVSWDVAMGATPPGLAGQAPSRATP